MDTTLKPASLSSINLGFDQPQPASTNLQQGGAFRSAENQERQPVDDLRYLKQTDRLKKIAEARPLSNVPAGLNNQSSAAEPDNTETYYSEQRRKRQRIQKNAEKGRLGNAFDSATSGLSSSTSKALAQAWLNLIDSFGLTLIWINIHAFLSLILGEHIFVRLGHEWIDQFGANKFGRGKEARQMAYQAGEKIHLPEVLVLILLDLVVLIVIVLSLALSLLGLAYLAAPFVLAYYGLAQIF